MNTSTKHAPTNAWGMTNAAKRPTVVPENALKRVRARRTKIAGTQATLFTALKRNGSAVRVCAQLPVANRALFNALPNLARSSSVTITFRVWTTIVVVARRMHLPLMVLLLVNEKFYKEAELALDNK